MARRPHPGGLVSVVGLGLRRFRLDVAVIALMGAVVLLSAFGVIAVPRYVNRTMDESLQRQVESAQPQQRDVTFFQIGRIGSASSQEPFAELQKRAEGYMEAMGPQLQRAISDVVTVIDSPVLDMRSLPLNEKIPPNRHITFRVQPGLGSAATVVEGRLPEPAGSTVLSIRPCDPDARAAGDPPCAPIQLPLTAAGAVTAVTGSLPPVDSPVTVALEPCDRSALGAHAEPGCVEIEIPLFETAVTASTADRLGVEVGDRLLLNSPGNSGRDQGLLPSSLDYSLVVEIVGIIELPDIGDDLWLDSLLHQPNLVIGGLGDVDIFATGLLAEADYRRLMRVTSPSRYGYRWRFVLDYTTIDATSIEALGEDIAALGLVYQSRQSATQPQMATGIDDIVTDHRQQRQTATSFLSLLSVGLLGLAAGTAIVIAALANLRRERPTTLMRARGASARRLAASRFLEMMILFVPPALLGMGLARITVAGRDTQNGLAWALGIAAGLSAIVVAMATPALRGDLRRAISGQRGRGFGSARRLVVETTVLVLAILAVVLLRRRGLGPAEAGFDPLLASAPLVISAGAGVLLLRIIPYSARLVAAVASRRRGLVSFFAARSTLSRPPLTRLPSVVILTAVALSVFGLILLSTMDETQAEGASQAVGADYRLESLNPDTPLSPLLDVESIEGVNATADATLLTARASDGVVMTRAVQIVALDLSDYTAVSSGTRLETNLPATMTAPASTSELGTDSNPLSAIVSRSWPGGAPTLGQVVKVVLLSRETSLRVEDVRDSFPGIEPGTTFAVVDRSLLASAQPRLDLTADERYVSAPSTSAEAFAAAVYADSRGTRVLSQALMIDRIRSDPVVTMVRDVMLIAVLLSVALAVAAVACGLALGSSERTRDLGYLTAVGLSGGQATAITATEQLPAALVAIVAGAVVGRAVAAFVLPALNLVPLTGTGIATRVSVPWGSVTLVSAVLLGTVAAAAGVYSYYAGGVDLAGVFRRGDRT
jgi:putative ABC transport system permease protein